MCVDDSIRRTNERTHIHEQKTEKCVFERRLIVCIKDRRKKDRRGQTQKKYMYKENPN
jgi:aminoglycoside phosphotransferase